MPATQPCAENIVIDEVSAALAYRDGDAEATIATLLEDLRYLRQQLVLAEGVMATA